MKRILTQSKNTETGYFPRPVIKEEAKWEYVESLNPVKTIYFSNIFNTKMTRTFVRVCSKLKLVCRKTISFPYTLKMLRKQFTRKLLGDQCKTTLYVNDLEEGKDMNSSRSLQYKGIRVEFKSVDNIIINLLSCYQTLS